MPMLLKSKQYSPSNAKWIIGSQTIHYRPETTDEKVIREVIDCRAYRRASAMVDVEPGETWLDLGANIGAFAVYCLLRGATAECYEPEPTCFKLLQKNVPALDVHRATVTAHQQESLELWTSSRKGNHYRGTILSGKGAMLDEPQRVPNIYAGMLTNRKFSGVKLDIEGSEFDLLDQDLLPRSEKLVLEYHTSRDKSMANLRRRMAYLKRRYKTVAYVPELDRIMQAGGYQKSFHDRVIYCRDLR